MEALGVKEKTNSGIGATTSARLRRYTRFFCMA
jgi:hypothetical protein